MVRITKPKKNLNDLEFINKFCCKKLSKDICICIWATTLHGFARSTKPSPVTAAQHGPRATPDGVNPSRRGRLTIKAGLLPPAAATRRSFTPG